MSKSTSIIILALGLFGFQTSFAQNTKVSDRPFLVCENDLAQLADAQLAVQVSQMQVAADQQSTKITVDRISESDAVRVYENLVNTYSMADASNVYGTDDVVLKVKADQNSGYMKGKLTFKNGNESFSFVVRCEVIYQTQPALVLE